MVTYCTCGKKLPGTALCDACKEKWKRNLRDRQAIKPGCREKIEYQRPDRPKNGPAA